MLLLFEGIDGFGMIFVPESETIHLFQKEADRVGERDRDVVPFIRIRRLQTKRLIMPRNIVHPTRRRPARQPVLRTAAPAAEVDLG